MSRLPLTLLFCAAAGLSGCDDQAEKVSGSRYAPETTAPVAGVLALDQTRGFQFAAGNAATADKPAQSGESYIYDHNLTVSMASEFIKARFERARDRCQNDPALKCKITSASFRLLGGPDAPLPVANLSVALPHDGVTVFEESLLAALPDEDAGDVRVTSRNTSAQNVTNQVKDIDARLNQLTDYRSRMMQLAKRGGAKTEDLIKIEGEISRTQSEIEQIEGQRRDLAERIAKENLSISFEPQSTTADALQPIADVWQSSLRLLGSSAATVLALTIGILPWLPVLALVYFLIRWLWRRARRKKA
jgi:Domain of unknown function (DUF4349)